MKLSFGNNNFFSFQILFSYETRVKELIKVFLLQNSMLYILFVYSHDVQYAVARIVFILYTEITDSEY